MLARARGFTLVELLVAGAVLTLLLAAAAGAAPRLGRLERSDGEALARLQRQRAAVEALRFEISQAGYGEAAPGLRIERARRASAGQALGFAYRAERWRAAPARREIRLEVGRDGRGEPNLYRAEGTAPRQPLVAGPTALRVVAVATADGWAAPPAPGGAVPGALALGVELDFAWGATVRVAVPLRTPQTVTVAG